MDSEKKVYLPPTLIEYGDLILVTQFGTEGPDDGLTGSLGGG